MGRSPHCGHWVLLLRTGLDRTIARGPRGGCGWGETLPLQPKPCALPMRWMMAGARLTTGFAVYAIAHNTNNK
jgi:hypothetical protein